jgi:hypothetical protein
MLVCFDPKSNTKKVQQGGEMKRMIDNQNTFRIHAIFHVESYTKTMKMMLHKCV